MARDLFIHSFFLFSAVVLTYVWTSNPILSLYTLQLIGIFVFLYFLSHTFIRPSVLTSILDAVIFTVIILLLITSTGGISSPLFFLIYFLLFAIALLFEPYITLILSATLVLYFWPKTITLNAGIQLLSVLFILPLAIFLGEQYLRLLASKEEIKILKKTGRKLEKHLTTEETNILFWLNLNFKEGILSVLQSSADLLASIGQLNLRQKDSLEKIHSTAKQLLKTGEQLERSIDLETDKK